MAMINNIQKKRDESKLALAASRLEQEQQRDIAAKVNT